MTHQILEQTVQYSWENTILPVNDIQLKIIFQDKTKSKAAKKTEGDLKPVKEVPITENEEGSKNESGCVIS